MNRRAFIVFAVAAAMAASAEIAVSKAPIPPVEPNVMRTEANAPVVKEVRLKTQFVCAAADSPASARRSRPRATA